MVSKNRHVAVKLMALLVLWWCIGLFFSCGIEEYVYLEPVEITDSTGVDHGSITIPGSVYNRYFRYFTLFYRIYMSDQHFSTVTADGQRQMLNPSLASHYRTLEPYTVSETVSPSAIGSVFNRLSYYQLWASRDGSVPISMQHLLNNSEVNQGDVINLYFQVNNIPYFTRSNNPSDHLYLFRDSIITPSSERLFFAPDFKITNDAANPDVSRNIGSGSSGEIAYVSIYILATGIDDNYSIIYSRPKHVGIFLLPNKP